SQSCPASGCRGKEGRERVAGSSSALLRRRALRPQSRLPGARLAVDATPDGQAVHHRRSELSYSSGNDNRGDDTAVPIVEIKLCAIAEKDAQPLARVAEADTRGAGCWSGDAAGVFNLDAKRVAVNSGANHQLPAIRQRRDP